jgi:enamine deaminase RidA (YjgF/YER057c/UK114 family)
MTDEVGPADYSLFEGVPYAYGSVAPPGALLFTAGACPLDPSGTVVSPGDPVAQARAALANLKAVLRRHGAGPEHLVRTTIYVVGDRRDLVEVWDAIAGGLAPHRPPSTLLGVSALGYQNQLVEIDAIAALSGLLNLAGPEEPNLK